MARLKILTANTAFGIADSDSLVGDLRSLIHFHSWKVVPFLLTGNRLTRFLRYSAGENPARFRYLKAHSNLHRTLEMVEKAGADIIVLNEIIFQLHGSVLESTLRSLGYRALAWGHSAHYPDATVSTLVAARVPASEIDPKIPQFPQMGGGGGAIAMRLENMPITIVGCHLANGVPQMREEQLRALTAFAQEELNAERSLVLAGDFNTSSRIISKTRGFNSLRLRSIQSNCPICLPNMLQNECDHIYVPDAWKVVAASYLPFGSDHLAVLADVAFDLDIAEMQMIGLDSHDEIPAEVREI